MRRNSTPEGTNAEVSLEFEVDGTMYRINRSPQMKDPETGKKKSHSVDLAEIDVNGSVIAGDHGPLSRKQRSELLISFVLMFINLPNRCVTTKPIFKIPEIKV